MRRLALLLLPALLAGCSVDPSDAGVTADCSARDGHVNPLLVLMAQAVPSAEFVPCIGAVPASWRRGTVDVRDGRAVFAFTPSSMDGMERAVLTVALTDACDLEGATEVPSDEPGTRRYERLRNVEQGYDGERYYVYDGGCTTFDFQLPGEGQAQQVGAASLAVDFVSRASLREGVRERSDGRLELDGEEPS